MTFVDNHDVSRLATILTDKKHIPLAYGLLFGMPGIPCIYYGSEWGEEGAKAPDNDYALRPCFEEPKPNGLTELIREMISARRASDALCNGSYRSVVLTNHQLIFERRTDSDRMLIAINASDSEYTADHQELQGTFEKVLSYPRGTEAGGIFCDGAAAIPASRDSDASGEGGAPATETASGTVDEAAAEAVTLQGQIVMPPYSVQYFHQL